jgi:hypothetical protein
MIELNGFSGNWQGCGQVLTIKVFPECRTRTGASSASHGRDGQVVMFGLLVGRQVMIGKLLGFTSDVCPLVVLSVVIGQM